MPRPPPHLVVQGEWRRPLLAGVGACRGRRQTRVSRGSGGGRCWRVSADAAAAAKHGCQGGVAAAVVGGCRPVRRPPPHMVVKGEWRRPLLESVGGCRGRRQTRVSRGSGGGRCWRVSAGAAAANKHGCEGGVAAAVVGGCRRERRPPPDTGVKGEWRRPLLESVGGCRGRRHTWLPRGSGGGRCWRVSAGAAAAATHGCEGGVAVAVVGGCQCVRWPPLHMGVKWEWRPPPA